MTLVVAMLLAAVLAQRAGAQAPVSATYTATDTRAKAESLWREGMLERVHLFPLDGGGEDIDLNVVYVPKHAAVAKAKLDQHLLKLAGEGHIADYEAAPEYHGESFVPTRIVVRAMAPDGTIVLHQTIEVW
jgi:hypothetical protein